MSYELHDMFRDRLSALPLAAGRRGIAAMLLVEIVRWLSGEDRHCVKSAEELGELLNLRPGDVAIALRTLESLGAIDLLADGRATIIALRPLTAGKTPETLREEISEAIGHHAAWKRRLRHAIDTAESEISVELAGDDHACEFGRWLYGSEFSVADQDEEYERIRQHHAQFHRVAAATLQLALAGKKKEAGDCMASGGIYAETSHRLIRALGVWKRRVLP